MRVSVGAVNVRTGNFAYFDNTQQTLRAEHFMASGALPPGFPAVEIDGEFYWDGGMVSNTPLYKVLVDRPAHDALIFQVDLWSAVGELPHDLAQVAARSKDIQFSSRTRLVTEYMRRDQEQQRLLHDLMALVPESRRNDPAYRPRRGALVRRADQPGAPDLPQQAVRGALQGLTSSVPTACAATGVRAWTTCATRWRTRTGWTHRNPEHPFVTHDVHRR